MRSLHCLRSPRRPSRLLQAAALALLLPAGAARAEPASDGEIWRKAAARTAALAEGLDGVLGVAVRDLTSGRSYAFHGGELFPTASIIKVAVLVSLYAAADEGRLDLAERVPITRARVTADAGLLSQLGDGTSALALQDLAAAMIVLSENSATNILIDRLGLVAIGARLRALGLPRTALRRRMLDLEAARAGRENVSTPEELLRLFELLYRGRALSPASTQAALRLLRTPEKAGGLIPRGVPAGVSILHKPGELDGVRGDCGVVEEPRRPFAICVLTTFLRRPGDGEEAAAQVTRIWYELFHRLGNSAPYGRQLYP